MSSHGTAEDAPLYKHLCGLTTPELSEIWKLLRVDRDTLLRICGPVLNFRTSLQCHTFHSLDKLDGRDSLSGQLPVILKLPVCICPLEEVPLHLSLGQGVQRLGLIRLELGI